MKWYKITEDTMVNLDHYRQIRLDYCVSKKYYVYGICQKGASEAWDTFLCTDSQDEAKTMFQDINLYVKGNI